MSNIQTFWLILVLPILYGLYRYYQYGESKRSATNEQIPKKDNLLLVATPIEPNHATPKLRRWGASESLRRFFADFEEFRIIANRWVLLKDTPWRLQELGDIRLRCFNNAEKKYGRRYDIFYNQQRAGLLEITDTKDYSTEEPRIHTNVMFRDARLISFQDISTFLVHIAALLSAGTGDEYANARRNIEAVLTEAHASRKISGTSRASNVLVKVSLRGAAT